MHRHDHVTDEMISQAAHYRQVFHLDPEATITLRPGSAVLPLLCLDCLAAVNVVLGEDLTEDDWPECCDPPV